MSGTWNVCEQSKRRGENMSLLTSKAIVLELLKPSKMNISSPCVLDATFGAPDLILPC